MSFNAMTWSWEYAPVASMTEKGVLMALANDAGPDGCNAFPSTNTIAEEAMCSSGTATKTLKALRERGIIAYGDQSAAEYLDPRYRPTVYDIQIPYSWYSEEQIKKVNAKRAEKGLPPLTPDDRPPLGPAPDRKSRSDKGVPNPARGRRRHDDEDDDVRGVSETPLTEQASDQGEHSRGVSETGLNESRGVSETGPRGVSETPDSALKYNPSSQQPPKGGCENRAHDAPTRASTPDAQQVSTGSPESTRDDDLNSTRGQRSGGSGRGAMLAADWEPSADMLAVAAAKHPGVDLEEETDKFRDHFVGNTKFRRTAEGWQGAWRNWIRRAWKDAGGLSEPEPDLFSTMDGAAVEAITEPWLAYWAQRGTIVTPALRGKLAMLVGEALAAGADPERVKEALKACREPYPAPFRWDKAMAGVDPYAGGGGVTSGMGRQEREQHYRDLQYGRGLLRAQQREADGTADDPMESMRQLIIGATADAAEALRREGELPTPGAPWPPHTPKEIAQ